MIIEESPLVIFIPENNRQPGISAFMRIKNGEDYLKATILSIINQVDEIICVFNDCNDNTENILVELENEYSKIKVYKYIPPVYVMNSEKYLETEENSVNSFSYYSNFALSKTTKKYCIKIDDDEIFFPNILTKFKNELIKTNNKYAIGIMGINLVDYKEELFVNNNDIYTNGSDTIFFKYNNDNKFFKTTNSERFAGPIINRKEIVFYHTKRCKKDRGINNYQLDENQKSRYHKINNDYFENLKLIKFEDYMNEKNLINPINLGFKFINNSVKKYNSSHINFLEDSIKFDKNILPNNKQESVLEIKKQESVLEINKKEPVLDINKQKQPVLTVNNQKQPVLTVNNQKQPVLPINNQLLLKLIAKKSNK